VTTPAIKDLRHSLAGCHFDFTRQRVDGQILNELQELAQRMKLSAKRDAMFSGDKINTSENRGVLHSALRDGAPKAPTQYRQAVAQTKQRLFNAVDDIRSGNWRGFTNKAINDVVHIGIGGSHLGPELVVKALAHLPGSTSAPNIHFVANVDANDINTALIGLNPETTLFIVVSKSFGTLETQVNATSARSWFLERTGRTDAIAQHFIGVTTNLQAAAEFGFAAENLFPLWDWVGGRFSLWSAVGLPILLQIGAQAFSQLLAGAQTADEHFASAEAAQNIPILAALLATWNTTALGCNSLAVLSYDQRLALLPNFLQQLEMESNGKSVDLQRSA
jgi:glucose-6-phosphate isomerase